MDNMYCKKCKTAMIRCSECGGRGKGTGYHCQVHGAAHGHPKKR